MTDVQKQAFEDYKKGLKYADIAVKYNVTINTVKQWAKRHFKKKGDTKNKKKVSPRNKKSDSKNPVGAPKNNKNAAGNSGGAPELNQNNLKHGAYAKMYRRYLDPEKLETLELISTDPEVIYEQNLKTYILREIDILTEIREIKNNNFDGKKVMLDSVTKIHSDLNQGTEDKIITETTAAFNYLKVLNIELTKIQASKNKCAEALAKIRSDKKENSINDVTKWLEETLADDD